MQTNDTPQEQNVVVRRPGPGRLRAIERLEAHRKIWTDTPVYNKMTRQRKRYAARKGK